MSDDTTTWLKKNPSINPLRRSLKTSLRFHVPSSDMNASIISNPDKVKDQGLFIPRMLQRPNMQLRKSRAHEFKVPEFIATKPVAKKKENGSSTSGVKTKKIPTPNQSRKSLLPVARTKSHLPEKNSSQGNLPRPSFLPGVSGRRTMARREMIKKMVELSEVKRNQELETSQQKLPSADNSVLRSILKRRASLRRASQISESKPKVAKKVLFDGFETSFTENKENGGNASQRENQIPNESNDFTALDEPTVFLNLKNMDESSFEEGKEDPPTGKWTVEPSDNERTSDRTNINNIMTLWRSYKENLDSLENTRNSLEDSFESFLEHSLQIKQKYDEYKKNSDEIYNKLSKLGQELEESLKKGLEAGEAASETPRRSTGRKGPGRSGKIKMSDKSKGIKKSSAKKSMQPLKKDLLKDMEDSFSLVMKKSFLQV